MVDGVPLIPRPVLEERKVVVPGAQLSEQLWVRTYEESPFHDVILVRETPSAPTLPAVGVLASFSSPMTDRTMQETLAEGDTLEEVVDVLLTNAEAIDPEVFFAVQAVVPGILGSV